MLSRTQAWQHAIAAGDASMRSAGRADWSQDDWTAMVAEFDRLQPALDDMTRQEIAAYLARRLAAERPDRRVWEPCIGCGTLLTAAARRKPCPHCGSRNPRR